MRWRRRPARLDLDALPPDLRATVEAVMAGEEVAVVRGGEELGTLDFHPRVLEGVVEGVVMPATGPAPSSRPTPEGVRVVAVATRLSRSARRRLADTLGEGYVVLDLNEAPDTADVVLTHPVSPQLVGLLATRFRQARIVVTEIEDEELGVHRTGAVRRLLDAGASTYLPPLPLEGVAGAVHHHLEHPDALPPGAAGPVRSLPISEG